MSHEPTGSDEEAPISLSLRDEIRRHRLTAYAAAKRAGVSVDAVQRFLNGQRGLNLATADKLAASLGLTLCPESPPPAPEHDRRSSSGPAGGGTG
jgi:hypothetical protein